MSEAKRKRLLDAAACMCLIIAAVAVYFDADNIRIISRGALTAAFFPRFLAVMIIGLSLIILCRSLYGISRDDGGEGGARGGVLKELAPAAATFGFLGLYVFTINALGFLLSTAAYIFAQAWIMAPDGRRGAGRIALLGAGASVGIYLIFKYGFQLMVPGGILG